MLVVTPGIANLIRENKMFRITSSIQTGAKHGMMLLDDHIFNLWRQGLITKEDGLAKCNVPEELAAPVCRGGARHVRRSTGVKGEENAA